MRLLVTAEIGLREPDAEGGLVTWFDIQIVHGEDGVRIGSARAARVHLGEALEWGADVLEVLDADSSELEALYGVFFDAEQDDLREEYRQGVGSDLLYIDDLTLDEGWQGRNMELAVADRLGSTVGEGCELIVVPYGSDAEALRLQRLGFQVSTPGQATGYVHLQCALRHPRVLETEDGTGFRVTPDPYEP